MKQHSVKWVFALILSLLLTLTLAGCQSQKGSDATSDDDDDLELVQDVDEEEDARTDTCFIYTDALLDDLCGIEYLAQKYDHAVVLVQNPEGLKESDYAAKTAKDKDSFIKTISTWFSDVTDYSEQPDTTDLSKADLYLLAPLTEAAQFLKDNPSLLSNHTLMMAGISEGPDGAGEEWNAAADEEAYRYVTENMTDLNQVTGPECEAEYDEKGYPFEAQFLEEYKTQMESLNENICCYDLQAVSLAFK